MLKKFVIAGAIGILLAGCGAEDAIVRTGKILDKPYEIIVNFDGITRTAAAELADLAEKNLEGRYKQTAFNSDFMEKLNEKRTAEASADFEQVASLAETVRRATDGAYDYRLGAVRELWNLYNRKPTPPEPSDLTNVLADAQALTFEAKDGKATLSGIGKIDFGLLAAGSAVDYAAGELMGGGVIKGRVSLGRVSRSWGGSSESKNLWEFVLPPLPGDSIYKILTPPEGAIAIVHPSMNGFEFNDQIHARMIDPLTGSPSDSVIVSVGWAEDAAVAGAYAEAFFVMGRRNVFNWIEDHQPAGAYLIYTNQADGMILGETDSRLAGCVTDSLPIVR